ncbi:unnamed protein product [Lampetra fluviatilis]
MERNGLAPTRAHHPVKETMLDVVRRAGRADSVARAAISPCYGCCPPTCSARGSAVRHAGGATAPGPTGERGSGAELRRGENGTGGPTSIPYTRADDANNRATPLHRADAPRRMARRGRGRAGRTQQPANSVLTTLMRQLALQTPPSQQRAAPDKLRWDAKLGRPSFLDVTRRELSTRAGRSPPPPTPPPARDASTNPTDGGLVGARSQPRKLQQINPFQDIKYKSVPRGDSPERGSSGLGGRAANPPGTSGLSASPAAPAEP